MDPLRQAITIPSTCNKAFRTMFLQPDSEGTIPRVGYRMGDQHYVEALQWLTYICRRRHNVSHVGNGREVRLAKVPNVKIDGYCKKGMKSLSSSGAFSMGIFTSPIDKSHW